MVAIPFSLLPFLSILIASAANVAGHAADAPPTLRLSSRSNTLNDRLHQREILDGLLYERQILADLIYERQLLSERNDRSNLIYKRDSLPTDSLHERYRDLDSLLTARSGPRARLSARK
ncbi:hypothetical protein CC1G_02781 [Coprinopsis cinerea okayama7|uniref:Uncharacterized protein n=1 Tax=Coprinopsis cinerea (strain Okayama-7 / 130 / ATCC MYA-4618 / FGSC 9003) TaxID=240176 RepID=A8N011_COPC7|nr:hypothetical protein CC1G_02781 [Coprinopsis cinerea okayama7\|eukprot:XP_001828200.1 hypothetical protein CC1G_02781 [Coprinopsis cinerea okayama7\